jgi:hypothetical protein
MSREVEVGALVDVVEVFAAGTSDSVLLHPRATMRRITNGIQLARNEVNFFTFVS